MFVLMLLIGAWANVTQVAAQETLSAGNYRIKCTVDEVTYYVATRGTSDDNEDRKLVLRTNPKTALSVWNLEALSESGHFAPGLLAKSNRKWGNLSTGQLVIIGSTESFSPDFEFMKNADGKYAIRQNGNSNLYMTVNGTVADGAYLIGQTAENYQWELEEATELPRTYTATWKVGNKTLLSEFVEGTKVTIPSYWERSMASSTVTVNGVESSLEALRSMTITEPTTIIEVVGTLKVPEAGKYYRFINANFITRYMKESTAGNASYSENLSDNELSCVWEVEESNGLLYLKNVNSGQYLTSPNGNNDIPMVKGVYGGCPYYFKLESEKAKGLNFVYIASSDKGENGTLLNMNIGWHNKVLAYNRDDWASYWIAEEVSDITGLTQVSNITERVNVRCVINIDGENRYETSNIGNSPASCNLLSNYKWLLKEPYASTLKENGVSVLATNIFNEAGGMKSSVSTSVEYKFDLKTTDILQEGRLYQISSAITTPLASQNGRGGKKMYGKPEMIYTKAVGDDLNTEPFLAMAHSLWKFEYTNETQGFFKIYNQVTGQYMGPVVDNETKVVFTDAAGAGVYKLIPASALHQNAGSTTEDMTAAMYSGALFKIAASDATVALGDKKKLHIQNTGSNQLIGYDADEIWSKWFFTASHATIAKVEFVKDIDQRLLVQGRVTPSKKADMTDMVITKEDGTDVTTVLTDDNAATSASANVNSYLQVDLGSTSVSAFAFYTKRTPNSNNRPTEIEVQASADGTNFTRLYTFYGIPVANEDFYSPSYPLEGQRYLRFVVKATYSASPTFDFSEFHIQTTKGVLPDALAAASLAAGKAAIDAVCSPYNTTDGYYQGASEDLRAARDNALDYAVAHKALKDRIADLTPFIDRTDLVEGDEVHQFTVARTATAATDWKAALSEINTYVNDVNNANINTKVGCETVLATLPAITFNTPKVGEVYLLKSAYNSKYAATPTQIVSGENSSSLDAMADGYTNETKFMLQYTEDGKLISVVDGTELILRNLNTYTFSEHPRYPNTYLVASPDRYMYAGDDALNFNGFGETGYAAQQTSWMLEHVKTYPVTAREVSEGKNWATFYTNEAVYLPNGMKARYVDKGVANPTETEDGSKVYQLTYTEIKDEKNILPANTGVLLVAENSGEHKLYASRCASSVETPANNALVGMATEDDPTIKEDGVTLYALGKPAGYDAGFYRYTGSTIPLNKAFLKMDFSTGSTSAFGFIFVDGDDATGIEAIQPAAVGEEDGVCYDLTGKRVVNPTRPGIYIKNGKKLVIK